MNAWLLLAAFLLFPQSSATQPANPTIRVTVRVLSDAGEPVADALVRAVDGRDRTIAQAFASASGLAQLTLPVGGTYRFAVERMGYAAVTSREFVIDAIPSTTIELRVPVSPVPLSALEAVTNNRCRPERSLLSQGAGGLVRAVGSFLGLTSKPVLSEVESAALLVRAHHYVMTSLNATVENRPKAASYLMRIVRVRPGTVGETRVMTKVDTVIEHRSVPLRAPSAEWLAEHGFATPRVSAPDLPNYHMPTPEVITSQSFSLTHCFRGVIDTVSGRIGLAFDPMPDTRLIDVTGIVWVDTLARRPVRIEYRWTRLAEFLREHEWRYAWSEAGLQSMREFRQAQRQYQEAREPVQKRFDIKSPPNPNEDDFGGRIEFGPIKGAQWDIVAWEQRWPGMRGSAQFVDHIKRPSLFRRDYYINNYVHVFAYATTAQVIEVVSLSLPARH